MTDGQKSRETVESDKRVSGTRGTKYTFWGSGSNFVFEPKGPWCTRDDSTARQSRKPIAPN